MSEFKEKDLTGSAWLAKHKETGETKLTKNGKEYFSGNCLIGGKKYFVTLFDNRDDKKFDKSPDFTFMFQEPKWQAKGQNPVTQLRNEPVQMQTPF